MPKISVIIPLYNHEKYIKESVHSVLEQSIQDFELIIINDGSTDNSEEVVKAIKDDRIKYFYQDNQGAHNTINRGIQLAEGEYISILNSDDIYYKNRFEEALKVFESDSSVYAVFSHLEFVDDKGDFIRLYRGAEDNRKDRNIEASANLGNNIVLDLLGGNFLITTSNLFCRKSVFTNIGYFRNLRYAHDYDFFLRLCSTYKVCVIDVPLLKYRQHGTNTLKENEAEVSFEAGLVLADFLLNNDLKSIFEKGIPEYDVLEQIFLSMNDYRIDRMIMALLMYGTRFRDKKKMVFKELSENTENTFRKTCVANFKSNTDVTVSHSYLGRALTSQLRKVFKNRI